MSNLEKTPTAEPCHSDAERQPVLEALPGRPSELGGLPIRRILPRSRRRLVGPWCFFDAFGPLSFSGGKPMDVPPHPHIGLQTVSWLLAGEVLHNDSLGLSATARPGVLNLMTAGRGIAHSEKTPPENGGRLQGVQLWVALPDASRYTDPGFESHSELPELELEGGSAIVILGELGGKRSPGRTFSPIVGVDVSGNGKNPLRLPLERDFEHAFVPLAGSFELDAQKLSADTLYYLGSGRRELDLSTGGESSRGILIGGAPFREEVFMWWNFVGRTREEIAEAREDWEAGRRFGEVEAYRGARLEAPPFDERR